MPKFRKKALIIEATQYHKGDASTHTHVCKCLDSGLVGAPAPAHLHTLEGVMTVSDGDWVITGVKGEKYACKPDVFRLSYEHAE